MSTPLPAVADQGQVVTGRLSAPPAMANAQQSAHYKIGQVLKELIHASPHAFQSENDVLRANAAVDAFVNASVPQSARLALSDIPARAPVEDVSKRVPPQGAGYALPVTAPAAIDYDKLAAAIVRAQYMQAQAETATVVPAPASETQENEENG